MRLYRIVFVILLGVLLMSACGSDDPDPTPTPTATATATLTSTPAATATSTATPTITSTPTPVPPPESDISGLQIGVGTILDAAFSPDGSLIVAGGSYRVWVQDTTDLEAEPEIIDLGSDIVSDVVFSPDGSLFAAGLNTGTVMIWDAASRELLQTFEGLQKEWANHLAISPDNQYLASVSQSPGYLKSEDLLIIDIATGETMTTIEKVMINQITYSPDGTLLAALVETSELALWDAATGEEVYRAQLSEDRGEGFLAFSDDGAMLYTFFDKRGLSALDVTTLGELVDFEGEFPTNRLQGMTASNGIVYIAGPDAKIWPYDVAANTLLDTFSIADKDRYGWVMLNFESAGDTLMALMSFDQDFVLYDTATQEQIGSTSMSVTGIAHFAFNPTGDRLLVQHINGGVISNTLGDVRLWDISGAEPVLLERYASMTNPLFDAAGNIVAIVENDAGDPTLTNVTTGATLMEGTYDFGLAYRFNPDAGLLANRSNDRGVFVYDYVAGDYVLEVPDAENPANDLIISPTGKYLAQFADTTLTIYDIASNDVVFEQTYPDFRRRLVFTDTGFWLLAGENSYNYHLLGYEFGSADPVTDIMVGRAEDMLAISPDQTLGIVATVSNRLAVLDLASGEIQEELVGVFAIKDVEFSPDGAYLAVGDTAGDITLHPIQ